MADYTHDFKIDCGETVLEGELRFNGDAKTWLRPTNGFELDLEMMRKLEGLLVLATKLNASLGNITTIEVNEKP